MSAPKISEFNMIYYYALGPYNIIVTVTVISIFLLGYNHCFRPRLPFFHALIYKKAIIFVSKSAEHYNWIWIHGYGYFIKMYMVAIG